LYEREGFLFIYLLFLFANESIDYINELMSLDTMLGVRYLMRLMETSDDRQMFFFEGRALVQCRQCIKGEWGCEPTSVSHNDGQAERKYSCT
jgi:hypothetical protein